MIPVRLARGLAPLLLAAVFLAPTCASAAANDRLASKSITQVYTVQTTVFALAEDARSFSWLNLFVSSDSAVGVRTVDWPWDGAIEGGTPWRLSMLLNANYTSPASDSLRVARLAAARSTAILGDAPLALRGDSLVFKDAPVSTSRGAALTALAVKGDTALLGFGRLGLAYARLNPVETATRLVTDSTVSFRGLPLADSNSVPLITCRWNTLCRSDSVTVPAGGLDSVVSLALDTTAGGPWILIATPKGLRRGLWRGTSFPYVALPGIADSAPEPVRSVFVSPSAPRAWAFTGRKVFYSDDHGATFRVPPDSLAPAFPVSRLTNYSTTRAPQVGFAGDTSFINFNMDSVGIARFGHDTLQVNSVGLDLDRVLINANDSLDVSSEEALTGVTVARNVGASVLVLGTARQGIFYRRLDLPAKTFVNLTSRAALKSGLGEVITYPTVFAGPGTAASPEYVRIGYRLKKSGKVTITVYNYAMEKVRTVVRNAPRQGGVPRSESFADDRWDGRDSSGRLVSVGTYYIRVESDQGEAAFGKVICVRGRK